MRSRNRRRCWSYRAQIEQCEKLKVELDLIHDAISRTKREIAMLHGRADGQKWPVNGELGAVVGGTEQATQRSWKPQRQQRAPPRCPRISRRTSKGCSGEIQERVISDLEACNFQDSPANASTR